MSRHTSLDALLDAVEKAEAKALADHRAGICHLSEWTCSFCPDEGL